MIPDDGRKWGKDKISITLTRRQWLCILRKIVWYRGYNKIFLDDLFTEADLHRAGLSIERQLPDVIENINLNARINEFLPAIIHPNPKKSRKK